jgi:hypothetical protein
LDATLIALARLINNSYKIINLCLVLFSRTVLAAFVLPLARIKSRSRNVSEIPYMTDADAGIFQGS